MQKPKKSKLELQQMMTERLAAEGHTGISLRIRGTHSGDWAVEILDGGADVKDEIAEAANQLRALYDLAE
jgi:hypothetical protein